MKQLAILICLLMGSFQTLALSSSEVEEKLYLSFQNGITESSSDKIFTDLGMSSFEQSLFVDALWDLVEEKSPESLDLLDRLQPFHYDLVQRLRIAILRIKYKKDKFLPEDLTTDILAQLKRPTPAVKLLYLLAAYEAELLLAGQGTIITHAKRFPQYFDIQDEDSDTELSDEIVADLFHRTPDVSTYFNGEYLNSVKLFMFCRKNRLYPCLMVMKDIHGNPVRLSSGSLWSHRALASSSRGLPSYSRNGNTPPGVFTMDSVMPVADQQLSFGKFRRIILNFIPGSGDEELFKSFLPDSSLESDWWKPNLVARDIGRNLLRIHGTGKKNYDPNTPYYPFMRTSGCIAQRENTYAGVTYKDQRVLLDAIITALDLSPTYSNELKVKGILYLVELDSVQAPVTTKDLKLRGIE